MVTFLKTWPSGREKSQGTESKTHVSTYKSKSSKKQRKFHEEVVELCVVCHSSEIRGLRSTKCSSETLQNFATFYV